MVYVRLVASTVPPGLCNHRWPAPDALGAKRLARIGIPWPEIMGPFVGSIEIICGTLVLLGLLSRLAAIPLAVTMVVAMVSTKLPILLGHGL